MSFWNRKKEKVQEKYKDIPFQHLAPIDTVDDKTVFGALDYALSQNNVHNIALTGNYGSGKSSILESYIKQKDHCFFLNPLLKVVSKLKLYNWILGKCSDSKKKILKWTYRKINLNYFLKISLATFVIENDTEEACNSKEVLPSTTEQEIEKSILQQIFYRKSGKKLPYSHFSRIKKIGFFRKLITELVVLILLLVPLYIKNGNLYDCILKQFSSTPDRIDITLIFLCAIAFFVVLYKIISLAYKLRLAKFSFQDAEIEFDGKDNEESLLNKYLDELLYFFEVTEYNVVVIEDLDRFKNTEIFIKLRELNTLLNNYEKINRKIIFVYALRDEVFKDSSRTKFFDFIIPVIPVINNQNSSDILLNLRNDNPKSSLKELDEGFLQDIGLYVDDMRLLINSINEFKIYDKKINESDYIENEKNVETKIGRDRNKIFALVLYKNLYPNDFALLAQNRGELYNIFQKKKDVIDTHIPKIEKEIEQLEKKIKDIENQAELDVNELRTIYIAKVFSKKPDDSYIAYDTVDFTSDEEFDRIKKCESLKYLARDSSYYSSFSTNLFGYSFSDIEKEINPLYRYNDREKMIKSKANGEIGNLKKQLLDKRTLVANIQQMSMEEMLDEFPSEQFVADVKTVNKNFIIYLLRCGYIDENYFEYISYFYANSLSEQEKQYLLLIKNRQKPNFDLLINNANFAKVVTRIKDTEWKLPAVLNYSMLYCIITFDDSHIDLFLRALWKYKLFNHNSLFLSNFNASSYIQSKLYRRLYDLFERENNWLDKLFGDEKPNVVYNFFIYVQFEKTENDVITFLTKDVSYLHRVDIDENAITSVINYHGLKFNLLEDSVKFPIYTILLNNDAYMISKNNFDIIIKQANGNAIEEPIKDYYTQISKLKNQNIKAYVEQNIEAFVNDIVLSTGDSMAESEEAFIELLNNEKLMTETKAKLIEKNNCVVSDITRIKGSEIQLADGENKSIDIRNLLYKCKKVSPTWQNIYENYKYNGNKSGQSLVDYLNNDRIVEELTNENPLTSEELKNESGNYDIASKVYRELLHSKDLSLAGYTKLMEVCPWNYQSLRNYDIDSEKMGVLIKQCKLLLTLENYSGIKQNYSDLLPKYIGVHFEEFVEKWNELNIVIEMPDLKRLLESFELDKDQKVKLMKSPFELWGTTMSKDEYIWLGKKIIELDISQEIQVSVLSILQNIDDEEDLIKIICLQGKYDYLRNNDIIAVVNSKMNEPYQVCVKREGKREKIPYSKLNEQFCAILKDKEIISSYQVEGKKIRVIQRRS